MWKILRTPLISMGQIDFVYAKHILCFKNVKALNEKHIDCFRYEKVCVDRFMMQYAMYTHITNSFVPKLC